MRILLIEDDPGIGGVVKEGLQGAHYEVDWERNGERGFSAALSTSYSLIILDLMVPAMDGWRICEQLRAGRNTTPILMLTARDAVGDRVRGLELGADDYLPKPFDFAELLARVRALIRRDRIHKSRVIRLGDLEIDTMAHIVTRAEKRIELTAREYTLLEALASHEGRVLTRETIQSRIWMDEDSTSNTVDVHIASLRRKIDSGTKSKLIHTVHGLGYTMRASRSGKVSKG